MMSKEVLLLKADQAALVDTSCFTVVPFEDAGKPQKSPPADIRPVLEIDPTKAILVDPSKFRVVAAQERT